MVEQIEEYLDLLSKRIVECISLSMSKDKVVYAENLLGRQMSELKAQISISDSDEIVKKKFSNFVNKVLSILEASDLNDKQYKAIRKLILGEIYGAQNLILGLISKKDISDIDK